MIAIDNNVKHWEDLIHNDEPIDENDPNYEEILKDLQGGIVKNYGRQCSLYIFIRFKESAVDQAKRWIKDEISTTITSTWRQLKQAEAHRKMKEKGLAFAGSLCKNLFLSYQGYIILGMPVADSAQEASSPFDNSFKESMRERWARNYLLNKDPDEYWYNLPENWDFGGDDQKPIHALILLAHSNLEALKNEAKIIVDKGESLGEVVACEAGYVLRNDRRKAIGPFGFVDGISQPLFLKRDYDKYREKYDTKQWDPKASLNLVLLKDPFGEAYSYGSYCVFQKLETNYNCFKKTVDTLAAQLGSNYESASALAFGRFKDGTPLALSDSPNQNSDRHSFNYADDFHGSKCPLQAHIRKMNPRKDGDDKALAEERRKKSRIFRAGITYFDNPNTQTVPASAILDSCLDKLTYLSKLAQQPLDVNIENISGLLFVCFQRNIPLQFAKLQEEWADTRDFPRQGTPIYLDPVIGHPATKETQAPPKPQKWVKAWGEDSPDSFVDHPFFGCVQNKGGEFFFAPSLSFLKNLS